MGGRVFFVIVAMVAGSAFGARAQGAPVAAPDPCRFALVGSAEVSAIHDARSFTVDGGRQAVRLADIEVPSPPLRGEESADAAGMAARTALTDLLSGRRVELRQREADTDRYGRMLAHAYLLEDATMRNVAQELLTQGYARVAAQVEDRACGAALLARERAARQQRRGLWGDPRYGVLGAQGAAELLTRRGRFALVEGKILSVRESGATIYMNFGRRWSEALTVTVWKRNEGTFIAAGLPPKSLENRQVRVRGFVEERNGPRIEASHPAQIEIAE